MKIYALQFDSRWKDKESNFALVSSLFNERKVSENSLIVLPEMFATGFCLDPDLSSAKETEKTELFLSELAHQMKSWVIGGMTHPSQEARKAFNTAVSYNPQGQKISIYKKLHPIPVLGEDKVHLPGNIVESFAVNSFTVTPAICYDLRFPELFRSALHFGTDLFVVLGCWPQNRIEHWVTLLRARAIENQAFVIGVNRVGDDQGLEYGGRTMVITPKGEILSDGERIEGVVEAEIKSSSAKQWRKEFPAIKEILEAS
mgnify:FL=1